MIRPSLVPLFVIVWLGFASIQAEDKKPTIELNVTSDFLALHLDGKAPEGTTSLGYRFAESGALVQEAPWMPMEAFGHDVPLPTSRWSEVEVRAMKGDEVLATRKAKNKGDSFTLLTAQRIAALPEGERAKWTAYLERSVARSANEYDILAAECRKLGQPDSKPAPGNGAELELDSDTPESWFAQAETLQLAESVMSYQTPTGGWSKSVDYSQGLRLPGTHWTSQKGDAWHYCGTIDNRTTTEQIKLLAGVYSATRREEVKAAALRGMDYLFEAQFPNGGWPQNYPIESGYHEATTLNDNAMVHVMEVLVTIMNQKPPFVFADAALQERARASYEKAIECVASAQMRINDELTVWCAQHDPLDLGPVRARTKEPPSLSGAESAELLKFLMRKAPVSPKTTAMIEPALKWLASHSIKDLRKTTTAEGKTTYVTDGASKEVYWARFYDLGTGRPIFPGSQDGINYATYQEMAAKNKVAYDFVTTKPRDLIEKEVARWRKRLEKEK